MFLDDLGPLGWETLKSNIIIITFHMNIAICFFFSPIFRHTHISPIMVASPLHHIPFPINLGYLTILRQLQKIATLFRGFMMIYLLRLVIFHSSYVSFFFFLGGRLVDFMHSLLYITYIYIYTSGDQFFFLGGWISNFTNQQGDLMGYFHGEHWHMACYQSFYWGVSHFPNKYGYLMRY